jgi:hypothetical protein
MAPKVELVYSFQTILYQSVTSLQKCRPGGKRQNLHAPVDEISSLQTPEKFVSSLQTPEKFV